MEGGLITNTRVEGKTLAGAVLRGLLAGAAGTAAMDLLWFARYRRDGGESGLLDWEFTVGVDDWEKAPVPAKVGKRIAESLLRRELAPKYAPITNNVVHWGQGLLWAALFGIAAGATAAPRVVFGLAFGPLVWSSAYVVLPPTGLYKPIWQYDAATLWKDFSAHLVYGVVTAAVFRALAGPGAPRRCRLGIRDARTRACHR
ncbi:MAG: hypothetical protein ACRDJ4_15860 [Actinomycetota bacterium]